MRRAAQILEASVSPKAFFAALPKPCGLCGAATKMELQGIGPLCRKCHKHGKFQGNLVGQRPRQRALEALRPKEFIKLLQKKERHRQAYSNPTLDFENFNPDAVVSPDELISWFNAIGVGERQRRIASIWFPGQPGRVRAVKNIQSYLVNKRIAMTMRLEGHINTALRYEDICDSIYARLPDYARW